MLCPKCYSLLTKGAKYCNICGTRIPQEDIQVEEVGSRVKNREKHKKEVRKKTKIIILGIIALVVVIAMLGFILFFKGNKPSYSPDNLVSQHVEKPLHLEKSKVTLNIGDEYTIQTNLKCTYQSKNEKICFVDTNGKITALSSGKTKIICTSESGKEKALQVIVNEKIETTVEENTDEDEYIFAHSDTELLTEADLENKDDSQLRLGLNEIYARHHCTFKTPEIADYFKSKSWYSADETLTSDMMNNHMSEYFNEIELKNISFIQAHR